MRLQAINASIGGISVGSAEQFGAMNAFIAAKTIKPAINRVFAFDQAPEAFKALEEANHFGEIVIKSSREVLLQAFLFRAVMKQNAFA